MIRWLTLVLRLAVAGLKSRRNLVLENLALRHQLLVLSRGSKRPRLTPLDRALWAWLAHAWDGWKTWLCLVQPGPVIQWHRAGYRLYVVERPSAGWAAQQLREAFAFTSPPKYLLRDRDGIYGGEFQRRAEALGLEEVRIAPRSPWQSPYVERLIGSVRRECLDHAIVLNQAHLHRLLKSYFAYYHRSRTHLGLDKDAPEPRPVQAPGEGKIVAVPQVGGLHHRYERLVA